MQTLLSFVVTCKGRLNHLKQSLPLLVPQSNIECIVVDYDCPDRTADWVQREHPKVKVVQVKEAPRFNLSRARNIGASVATAPWICFVDADILLDAGFVRAIASGLMLGYYYRPNPLPWEAFGTVICPRERFEFIGGYDEAIEGWGGEDEDLYFRFRQAGLRPNTFPGHLVAAIAHDDDERVAHYEVQDKWLNQRVVCLYLHLKYDLSHQLGTSAMDIKSRQTLFNEVRATVLRDQDRGVVRSSIDVNLSDGAYVSVREGWAIRRRWVYTVEPQSSDCLQQPHLLHQKISDYLTRNTPGRLHLGCGTHVLPGWLNADLSPCSEDVLPLDVTREWPFQDAQFDLIFMEHLIEHLTFADGIKLLKNCFRALRPSGTLRICTPDLAFLLALGNQRKTELQRSYIRWAVDSFVGANYPADEALVINNYVRNWGHQFIYSAVRLREELANAGFAEIVTCSPGESDHAFLKNLENIDRLPTGFLAMESMVFEAKRPERTN